VAAGFIAAPQLSQLDRDADRPRHGCLGIAGPAVIVFPLRVLGLSGGYASLILAVMCPRRWRSRSVWTARRGLLHSDATRMRVISPCSAGSLQCPTAWDDELVE
jgi:hypothetical protein